MLDSGWFIEVFGHVWWSFWLQSIPKSSIFVSFYKVNWYSVGDRSIMHLKLIPVMQPLLILDWDIAGRQGEDKGLDQATELEMREYFGDKQILSFENKPMWKGYAIQFSFYCIHLAIRQSFPLSRMSTVLWNFAVIWVLLFLNNPKDLDGSRFVGLFWKEKTSSYNHRNTVCV